MYDTVHCALISRYTHTVGTTHRPRGRVRDGPTRNATTVLHTVLEIQTNSSSTYAHCVENTGTGCLHLKSWMMPAPCRNGGKLRMNSAILVDCGVDAFGGVIELCNASTLVSCSCTLYAPVITKRLEKCSFSRQLLDQLR